MTSDTYTALTAVFPVLLLLGLVNSRDVDKDYRKDAWRVIVGTLIGTTFMGLVFSLFGTQWGGFWWIGCAICLLGALPATLALILFIVTSYDKKDDVDRDGPVSSRVERLALR